MLYQLLHLQNGVCGPAECFATISSDQEPVTMALTQAILSSILEREEGNLKSLEFGHITLQLNSQ